MPFTKHKQRADGGSERVGEGNLDTQYVLSNNFAPSLRETRLSMSLLISPLLYSVFRPAASLNNTLSLQPQDLPGTLSGILSYGLVAVFCEQTLQEVGAVDFFCVLGDGIECA